MGAGLDVGVGDLAFKCNFATINDSGIVTSRRADRYFTREGPILCAAIDGIEVPRYPDYTVSCKYATEHRCGLRIRGPGLVDTISGTDPLKDNLPLLQCRLTSETTNEQSSQLSCDVVNAVSLAIHQMLTVHPLNIDRKTQGKTLANCVLLRGAGTRLQVPPFKDRHPSLHPAFGIAPTRMISGWLQCIDIFSVPPEHMLGATGDYRTDFIVKSRVALEMFQKDFVFGFLHVKAVDDAGHDGRLDLKVEFIQKVDTMIGDLMTKLSKQVEKFLIVVTGDHSTPVAFNEHSCEPVPFTIARISDVIGNTKEGPSDDVNVFSEIDSARGALGRFPGSQVMPLIVKLQN